MKYIGSNIRFIFTKIKELLNSHNTDNSAHSELFKSWKRLRNPNNADIADALAATYKNGIGDVLVEVKDDTTFALEDIKLFFRPASFKLISANESDYEGIYITMDGTQGRYVAKTFADSEIMMPEGPSTISTPSELVLYPASSDAVLYTPQTLTDEQQKQARTNIGALDVNIETTPVDIDVTLSGRGENIVYVKDGWLKPCPDNADNELILQYGRVFVAIGLQRVEPNSEDILLRAKSAYSLYQKGLASESITVTNDPLNATQVYVTWNIVTRSNKHYIYYAQVSTAYQYDCTYCVEDDALINEGYKRPVYSTSNGVGNQTKVSQFRMSAAPTEDMHIATKQYVDTAKTEAQQLGLTSVTPGQIIKVKTVQDGKPTEWEAVNPDYTLTVTVNTQDGVTVTGQTVTVRAGDADGPVYGTAEYNGQPVSFRVADGFAYYAEVTDNLAAHFKPTSVKGVINGANAAVTLLYKDLSTIQTAPDIQAALDADMDLTELVGQQITCQRGNDTLSWDVVDYDSTAKVVTLFTHDVLPDNMQFEPSQALMYCEDGLAAGNYTFKWNNTQCYFTLTQAIPAGGQLMATNRAFQTYESVTATAQIESGTVSTEAIDGATNLGQTGTGNLNHHDRANNGSNNFGESGILQWLNSDSPANTPLPRLTKFSRPYVPTKAGFKAGLDADFLACIQDTVWKCSANNVYECPASLGGIAQKGNPYTVTAKFALASEIEVFGEYGGTQDGGTVWDLYVGAEATDRIKYYNNTARTWWLRSPYWDIASREYIVNTSGVGIHNLANHSSGVAVACKIAKSKADLSDISYDISLGITSATPGKTIKVKTVQDGKPTEWEAVDMPSQPDWNQNDNTKPDYIKNRPLIATNDDAMDLLAEIGIITPITNSNGEILTSSSNEIYSL